MKAVRPLLAAAAALLLFAGIPARAELRQQGDVIGVFDASLHPTGLPRDEPAAVAVRVAGNFRVADGSLDQLPQVRQITVAINRQGQLFDRGLPICDVKTIQPATETAARRICGGAIVGSGHVVLQVHIPSQLPFTVKARLLVFNGPRRGGHKLILAQAYGRNPPGAFVLTFLVSKGAGLFGTVMSTSLPRETRKWAFLSHFDMTLHRTYSYRGQQRSYVSAACHAPAGFSAALFPFARATYGFVGGQSVTIPVVRTCQVVG
jgi:hypothetical protein